jgi:hypothetical protein
VTVADSGARERGLKEPTALADTAGLAVSALHPVVELRVR